MNSASTSSPVVPSAIRRAAHYLWTAWLRPLALPLLLITAAKSALADINYVPTGSMLPTIAIGDVVFVNKLAYDLRVPFTTTRLARWSEPARGDIVVCFSPEDGTRLVKRVAALPGDSVELRHGTLVINGTPRTYAPLPDSGSRDLPAAVRASAAFASESHDSGRHAVMAAHPAGAPRDFGPIQIPAGHFFMLGDNRDWSHDSRAYGPIARAQIVGEATAVVASADLDRWLAPRFHRFFTALE